MASLNFTILSLSLCVCGCVFVFVCVCVRAVKHAQLFCNKGYFESMHFEMPVIV